MLVDNCFVNILLFKERCAREEAMHNVHRDRGVPANELIAESRFADILVVDAETSFKKHYEGSPTEIIKTILKKDTCRDLASSLFHLPEGL